MDIRPKRKKSKDNPYTLISDEKNNIYFITFRDNKNIIHKITVNKQIFDEFNKYELEDISQMHKIDKHIEHSEILDESLYKRSLNKEITVEEIVEKNISYSELNCALNKLPKVQKRRIILYYFYDLTLDEIGKIESCSFQAISKSINSALIKLEKILKK